MTDSEYGQPPPDDPTTPRPADRLALEASLDHTGRRLSGRSGHRTVIGCSATLRHALSPDRSSIRIASGADLIHRWVNIVQLRLMRDWTWDGLDESGITVTKTLHRPGLPDVVELAGTLDVPHALGPKSVDGDQMRSALGHPGAPNARTLRVGVGVRRPPQLGPSARPLQEKGMRRSKPQSPQLGRETSAQLVPLAPAALARGCGRGWP